MRAREKVVGRGSRWREECKGGSGGGPWRVMRRGLRAGAKEKEEERLRRARCARRKQAWARIERERGRQRQIPCLTRLGSMRSSARTPRRPRPSFLPSFSLLGSSLPSPSYLTRSVVSLSLSPSSFRAVSLSLFPSFSPFLFLRVPLFLSLSRSLLLASFVLRAFMSCC